MINSILIILAGMGLLLFAPTLKASSDLPLLPFDSVEEIDKWAKSSWTGGWAIVLKNNPDIAASWRSFTSGMPTSELTFFVKAKGKWVVALWYPVRQEEMKIEEGKNECEILGYDQISKKWVERLSIPYTSLLNKKV